MIPAVPAASTVSATRGAPRVLRGAGLACCSAALTVAAHAAAAGPVAGLPSPGLTVVLTVLLAGAGVALADRRRGFPAILAAVGGSQLALHVLLAGLGHGHGGSGGTSSLAMLLPHAVAALLTAVLLTGAEDAVFAVAAVLRWLLSAVAAVVPPLPRLCCWPLCVPVLSTSASSLLDVLLRRVHGRRGPPRLRL